jgi:uncharacterized protein YxeA
MKKIVLILLIIFVSFFARKIHYSVGEDSYFLYIENLYIDSHDKKEDLDIESFKKKIENDEFISSTFNIMHKNMIFSSDETHIFVQNRNIFGSRRIIKK